jgi:hypothetical protein
MIKVGQKVLIIKKEYINPKEEKEDKGEQTHIWSVHFSAF